jgi:hypothetical protein
VAGFAHIKRCLELADRDIAFAMEDRLVAKALLERLASVSRPGDGGPKLLLVFARMASQACDWIDGELRIEILSDAQVSVVEVLTDMGAGMRERVFPSFRMNVPLEEFARAVERVPHMIEPLTISLKTSRRVVLSASEDVRRSTSPPPMVEIDRESLYDVQSMRAPPVPSIQAPSSPSLRVGPVMPTVRPKVAVVRKTDATHPPPELDFARKTAGHKAEAHEVMPKSPALPKVAPTLTRAAPAAPAAPAAKGKSQRPPAAAAPAAKGKSQRPSAPQPGSKKEKSHPPMASKRPKVALSEPPDEEKIDTGWDDESS